MTDPRDMTPEDDLQADAAEYVLGTGDAASRAAAAARLGRDPAFAAAVAQWESRLAALNDGFAEVPAPPGVLGRVEARLFPTLPRRRFGWRGVLGGALAAGALALALLAVLPRGALPPPPALVPPLVAEVAAPDRALVFEARLDATSASLSVARVAGQAAAAGQVHQLWLIAGDAAPVPLGLLAQDSVTLALAQAPAPGAILAVSLEPQGGSPTGLPTGPVLATGAITPP